MKNIATLAFIVGLFITFLAGFNFFTTEKVADYGIVEVSPKTNRSLAWSPIIGIVLIVAGGGLYFDSIKKK